MKINKVWKNVDIWLVLLVDIFYWEIRNLILKKNDTLDKKMYIIIKIIWGGLNIFKHMYKK